MSHETELAVATDAAEAAGDIMLDYRRDGFAVERKSAYTDLVTEADHACQERIVEMLHDAFPDDTIRGEEEMELPDGENGREWIIDPIDGTTNFVHGFPFFCTSIALVADGDPVVGVVYAPVLDEMYTAVRGEGAELDGEQISVSAVDGIPDALVATRLTDWGNHDGDLIDVETAFLHDLLSQPSAFRRPGSAALDMCMVAAGRMDGHALATINRWDIAAGTLIVEEAGGTVRVDDAVFDGYLEVVASNGNIQADLERLFDRAIRGE